MLPSVRFGLTHRPFPSLARSLQATAVLRNELPKLQKDLKAPLPPPEDPRRPWFFTVYRFSNFAVIPFATAYCVFFADFGEHEHIFSPARRWIQEQRRTFFSLSAEELELARAESHSSSPPSSANPGSK
ncbi:hypothetical protein BDW22DRAFT_1426423 [Trametopsis cervina]|nr:hypothetical protein BDW22DRAFT_1426423 [Trametopsis cervina]